MTRISLALVAAALASMACACAPAKVRIVNPGVDRTPVVFESRGASHTFEQALKIHYDDGAAQLGSPQVQWSRNAFFNQQVSLADSNADGIISDFEAVSYAQE